MSIRLHSQLDSVEKKRSRLEQENEELRVQMQDLEVAKQVLQQEIDKVTSQCHLSVVCGASPGLPGFYLRLLQFFLQGCSCELILYVDGMRLEFVYVVTKLEFWLNVHIPIHYLACAAFRPLKKKKKKCSPGSVCEPQASPSLLSSNVDFTSASLPALWRHSCYRKDSH